MNIYGSTPGQAGIKLLNLADCETLSYNLNVVSSNFTWLLLKGPNTLCVTPEMSKPALMRKYKTE